MTEQELKAIIVDELRKAAPESDPETLDPNESIREALDIDSFSFLRVLVGLSDRTGVEIPETDYGQVGTLAAMTAYVMARLR